MGRSMKYGVISMKHFTKDLSDWTWLYTAGRCVHCTVCYVRFPCVVAVETTGYLKSVGVLQVAALQVFSEYTEVSTCRLDGGCWSRLR